jgi:23S rRNA pseudouridine1911/1915/1917 synthase
MHRDDLIEAGSRLEIHVPAEYAGGRLDKFLSSQFARYSRSFFDRLIEDGHVSINGAIELKSGAFLKKGDLVTIQFPHPRVIEAGDLEFKPPVEIVYEHPEFLIISKPAGLVMHAPSDRSTIITLVDWLVARYQDIKKVGYVDRPGIVHRLDKDTSGLVIIPRTNYAHGIFGNMFHDRKVKKMYYAVVEGHPNKTGTITLPISRDPIAKVKMSARVHGQKQREAETNYEVIEYFDNAALVKVMPLTGRTHQIRVHFAAIGHPLVGDTTYGKKSKDIGRQALHAQQLSFEFEHVPYLFEKEPPEDFQRLIERLRLREKK